MTKTYLPKSYSVQRGEKTSQPTLTYGLKLDKNRLWRHVDGVKAMGQAIQKMLTTEQNVYPIYKSYGLRTEDLIGQDYVYVYAVIQKRIRETVLSDERVLSVDDFSLERDGSSLTAVFTARTIFGETEPLRFVWEG